MNEQPLDLTLYKLSYRAHDKIKGTYYTKTAYKPPLFLLEHPPSYLLVVLTSYYLRCGAEYIWKLISAQEQALQCRYIHWESPSIMQVPPSKVYSPCTCFLLVVSDSTLPACVSYWLFQIELFLHVFLTGCFRLLSLHVFLTGCFRQYSPCMCFLLVVPDSTLPACVSYWLFQTVLSLHVFLTGCFRQYSPCLWFLLVVSDSTLPACVSYWLFHTVAKKLHMKGDEYINQ